MVSAARISVVVRLYNGIEYLEEALRSVIDQSFQEWDLSVGVNGHGEDGGEVYRKALEIQRCLGDSRIRVVNYPHVRGGAQALNALVADAIGSWVAILDADDKWHPEKLALQWEHLKKYPEIDVIGTWCQYFGNGNHYPQIPREFISKELFQHGNPMINSSVILSKQDAVFSERFGLDDYDLWIRLSLQNKIFYNIPLLLTYHRLRSDSYYNASKRQDVAGLLRYHYG